MKKVNLKTYFATPERFELRKVSEQNDIPKGLVTKTSKWVGFDLEENSYAKFSKTVFTKLIAEQKAANKPVETVEKKKLVKAKKKTTTKATKKTAAKK